MSTEIGFLLESIIVLFFIFLIGLATAKNCKNSGGSVELCIFWGLLAAFCPILFVPTYFLIRYIKGGKWA